MNNIEKFKQKAKEMINKKKSINRKEYQHNYYLAHREEILKRRKERYRKQKESK